MSINKNIKILVWLILGIFAILFCCHWWFSLSKTATADNNPQKDISVVIRPIVAEDKTIRQSYVGYVKPIHQVSVHTYIAGFIDKVVVQGGQEVRIGDLLFVLQQDEYKAKLNLAQSKVAQMKATLENAKIHYERMKTAGKQAISQTDLDNAKTALLTAQATLQQAKAEEQSAQVNYNYTTIYAPISGRVGDVDITNGDYVFPQSAPLVNIIQYNPIRVQFSVSDKTYLNEINQEQSPFSGWRLYVKLANGKVYNQTGKIKYLNNEINPQTGSIIIYSDFNNPNGVLLPNAYVDVILEKQIKNGIFLPQSIVNFTPTEVFVYTLSDEQKITKTPVQIGADSDDLFYISAGLTVGMNVITNKISPSQIGKNARIQGEKK